MESLLFSTLRGRLMMVHAEDVKYNNITTIMRLTYKLVT